MSRQKVRCCNKFGLKQGFYVTTECFYVVIESGQGQGISCHDRESLSRQILVKTKSFLVGTKYLYVATELAKVERFYVAIENSMSR